MRLVSNRKLDDVFGEFLSQDGDFDTTVSSYIRANRGLLLQLRSKGVPNKVIIARLDQAGIKITPQHFSALMGEILRAEQQATQQVKEVVSSASVGSAISKKAVAGKAPSAPLSHALPSVVVDPVQEPVPLTLDPVPQVETTPSAKSPSSPAADSSAQIQHSSGEAPTVRASKPLTMKEREALQAKKDDASRSALYPSVVYRVGAKWDGSWNRSVRTALDMELYGNLHHEFIKHRAVEVFEFLDPVERDNMQADMSDDNFKSSVNKSFLEALMTVTHPDYKITTVIAFKDGKTLYAEPKVVEAMRWGEIRNWSDFDAREREIVNKTSRGW